MTGRNVGQGLRNSWFIVRTTSSSMGGFYAQLDEYIGARNQRTGNSFTKSLGSISVEDNKRFETRLDALRAGRKLRKEILERRHV